MPGWLHDGVFLDDATAAKETEPVLHQGLEGVLLHQGMHWGSIMSNDRAKIRYDEGHPKITFRVTQEKKLALQAAAKTAGKSVAEYVLERCNGETSPASHPPVTRQSPDANQVRENINSLLRFFQKNAPNLDISEAERQMVKNIIKWMNGI
jgi:hypothetical protein